MTQFLAISLLIAAPAILAIWLARRDQMGLAWRRPPMKHFAEGGEDYPALLRAEHPLSETINGADVHELTRASKLGTP